MISHLLLDAVLAINISWSNITTVSKAAATIEVDVMPFLSRTADEGGPFDAYLVALQNLGAE